MEGCVFLADIMDSRSCQKCKMQYESGTSMNIIMGNQPFLKRHNLTREQFEGRDRPSSAESGQGEDDSMSSLSSAGGGAAGGGGGGAAGGGTGIEEKTVEMWTPINQQVYKVKYLIRKISDNYMNVSITIHIPLNIDTEITRLRSCIILKNNLPPEIKSMVAESETGIKLNSIEKHEGGKHGELTISLFK